MLSAKGGHGGRLRFGFGAERHGTDGACRTSGRGAATSTTAAATVAAAAVPAAARNLINQALGRERGASKSLELGHGDKVLLSVLDKASRAVATAAAVVVAATPRLRLHKLVLERLLLPLHLQLQHQPRDELLALAGISVRA